MIKAKGVWKSFDTLVAVSNFDLEVERGQTIGLIGPNGSGKTTFLRMVSTLAKPDSGRILVGGMDCVENPLAARRMISFMPAEFGTPQDMSIREYMDYFACAAGVPRRERRRTVNDVLELTDLLGRDHVIVRGLSTGNKQRLLLAKSLLGDRQLLILDEPASGLDPRARIEVRSLLKELAAMGKTIVVSSHILADLQDICDSICIIEQGKNVTSGTVDDLQLQYASSINRMVHITVKPDKAEDAIELIKKLEDVIECEHVEKGRLTASSKSDNCNYILRQLIDADIEILAMKEEKPNLEDIFISSTKGVVS